MGDDSITFRICPDQYMTKGYGILLVSYADAARFESMRWNMEKPGPEFSENRIVFQLKEKIEE